MLAHGWMKSFFVQFTSLPLYSVNLTSLFTSKFEPPGNRAMRAAAAAPPSTVQQAGRSISTSSRTAVVAGVVRRSKQYVARKELQKRAKQEYLRRIYENADSVEEDHLVFDLQPSSPRLRAELQESEQQAALNRQLAQQIPQLDAWQQLQEFVQQHGAELNFLNVVTIVTRAAALQQASGHTAPPEAGEQGPSSDLITQLTVLVLQQSSWFQPAHFAASAVALADLGMSDPAVWNSLTAAAQHKLGAFTFPQLTATLEALASAGYTPELSWVERTYRQAAKHLHAAQAADIAVLMGAWGELGYTPRDRLFMNQVKIITRRAFDRRELQGPELVQLMHGLARMPRYAPNQGWLGAAAAAVQHDLGQLSPGAVVDLLLSFVALEHTPAEPWMDAALTQLQQSMQAVLDQQPSSSSSSSSASEQQQQQQEVVLFLPPLDLDQLAQEQLLMAPGRLLEPTAQQEQQQQQQLPVDPADLQDLQALFEEADADEASSLNATQLPQQETGQQEGQNWASVTAAEPAGPQLQQQQQQQQQQQESDAVVAPTTRLSSSSSSSSDTRSLRRQLLQQELTPQHLGVLCWCLGRLQFQPGKDWMQLLGRVLLATRPAISQEVLVDVLVGCVAIGYLPVGALQQQLLSLVLQTLPSMPPECLRRACQALVNLEEGLQQYRQQPAALAIVLQPTHVTSAAAAAAWLSSSLLGPLQQLQAELAAAVTHRQGIVLTGSSTAQLADVLAFIAAAGQTPSLDYMSAAVTRAVSKLPDGCPTPAVCRLLWALARMGFKPHPELLHQLLAALQRGLHLLSSQDLADAGWALCTLRHRPGNAWLTLFLKEVAAKAPFMGPQALTDTLWALACFGAQPDREWLKQVVQAVGRRAAAGALSKQNAAVIVWALQQLGFQPAQMAPAAAAEARGGDAAAGADVPLGGVGSAVVSLIEVVQHP